MNGGSPWKQAVREHTKHKHFQEQKKDVGKVDEHSEQFAVHQ
jgi:hypothetical protein